MEIGTSNEGSYRECETRLLHLYREMKLIVLISVIVHVHKIRFWCVERVDLQIMTMSFGDQCFDLLSYFKYGIGYRLEFNDPINSWLIRKRIKSGRVRLEVILIWRNIQEDGKRGPLLDIEFWKSLLYCPETKNWVHMK